MPRPRPSDFDNGDGTIDFEEYDETVGTYDDEKYQEYKDREVNDDD